MTVVNPGVSTSSIVQSNATLNGAHPPGTSTASLTAAVVITPRVYLGVGVGLNTYEIVQASSPVGPAGQSIPLVAPGLVNNHASGETVAVITENEVPAWHWGAVGDGVTDDTNAIQSAFQSNAVPFNLWINFGGVKKSYLISAPIFTLSEPRMKGGPHLIAAAGFAPGDPNNGMFIVAGGASNTFTASGGTITTPTNHGMVTGNPFAFRYTTGLAGAIEARVYYAIKVTNTTFTVASTLANAQALTNDINVTAGSGTLYTQTPGLTRMWTDDFYLDTQSRNGVNGIVCSLQQQGINRKWRVDNAASLPAPAAVVPTTATTGGTILAGTYEIAVSIVNIIGETLASAVATVTTTGSTSTITVPTAVLAAGWNTTWAQGWYAYVSQPGVVSATATLTAASGSTSVTAISPALTVGGVYQFPPGTAGIYPGTTLTVTGTGTTGTLSRACTSALSSAVAMIANKTRQQAAGSPTAMGTALTLTAPPTTSGVLPNGAGNSPVSQAGGFGVGLASSQISFENTSTNGCDTAWLCFGATIFFGYAVTVQSVGSRGFGTIPTNVLGIGGTGLNGFSVFGFHSEPGAGAVIFDLTQTPLARAGFGTQNLQLEQAFTSSLGSNGNFIFAPVGWSGVITNAWGTFPGAPGYLYLNDPVFQTRDASFDYKGKIPNHIVSTPAASATNNQNVGFDIVNGMMRMGAGMALNRREISDAPVTVNTTDYCIAYQTLTQTRVVTLLSAKLVPGRVMVFKDDSGSASGTILITVTAAAGETVDGAASQSINTARGRMVIQANLAGTNWSVIG